MANAVATVTVPDSRYSYSDGSKYFVYGTLAVSASPAVYVTGGIALSFFVPLCKASRTPMIVFLVGQSGYVYAYVPGADASTGLLKIFQQSAATSALTEIPASAIPAGVSGDVIQFEAVFFGME
jgi:hypothetical protein